MAEPILPEAAVLGERIRGLRKRRRMTLGALAESADLSVGYISQIERNLASPSVPALVRLAQSLGVTVQWFFSGPESAPAEERDYVVRAGNRLKLHYEQGLTDELLTPKLSSQVEMILCRIPPGGASTQSYSHDGDEVGFVLEGALEIWIGSRHFLLNKGDCCAFSSREPHRYANPGAVDTVVIWAISPPSF